MTWNPKCTGGKCWESKVRFVVYNYGRCNNIVVMFSHVPTAKMSAVQFRVSQCRPEGLLRLPRVQMQKFVRGSLFYLTYLLG